MLRGCATVNFWAADLAAARSWYAELLGFEPYFERPGYCEFRIGDYQHELGIIDGRFAPEGWMDRPAGEIVYWHVDDPQAALDRLLSLGAVVHEGIRERGPGFVTTSVIDPFGNVLGVMYNKHYLEVLATHRTAPQG
jgi:predicted enzyme related to lactoylglutathione lyase